MPVAAPNPHANFARRKRYDQAVLADNPTHYWKLNEKSGTLCADVRGTLDGTYLNVELDRPSHVVDKDGSSVQVSNVAVEGQISATTYGDPGFPFTIEAWVSIPAGANSVGDTSPRIFDTTATTANYYGITLSFNGTTRFIAITYGDGTGAAPTDRKTYQTTTQVPIDTPTHIVAVCTDFNTVDIYFNGILQGQTSSGTGASINFGGSSVTMIGRNREASMSAEFDISNVATYDGIGLTQAQIQNHYDVGKNLTSYDQYIRAASPNGYWRLNEAAGSFLDSSTNSNNGTEVGTITRDIDGILTSGNNKAVNMPGVAGNYISVPVAAAVTNLANHSIECWVKPTAIGTSMMLYGENSSGGVTAGTSIEPDGRARYFIISAGATLTSLYGRTLVAGQVYHIVATLDSVTGMQLYVNGVSEDTSAVTAPVVNVLVSVYLGAIGQLITPLNGVLDEVTNYDYTLTAEQVLEHYKAGT